MGLTWRDGVTTIFMAAIAVIYAAFLGGTSAWLISSARGTTTAVLVLGMVGGCAIGAVGELYTGPQPRPARVLRAIATTLGLAALIAGIIGLVTGGTVALAVLVAATFALWLVSTPRHAFTPRPGTAIHRDQHEVIQPGNPAKH
jgi:hypothetical protein